MNLTRQIITYALSRPHQTNLRTPDQPAAIRPALWQRRSGFGLNEVIGIAAALMIAAVVVVPGLRAFATDTMAELTLWWETVSTGIFQS